MRHPPHAVRGLRGRAPRGLQVRRARGLPHRAHAVAVGALSARSATYRKGTSMKTPNKPSIDLVEKEQALQPKAAPDAAQADAGNGDARNADADRTRKPL